MVTATSTIDVGGGGYWTFIMERVPEAEPAPVVGTWKLSPAAGALAVGPEPGSGGWWQNSADDVNVRGCLFDDEITFAADGAVSIEMQGSTWLESWQSGEPEACGVPVAPHDGANSGTYSYDADSGSLTLSGQGNFLGLAKAYNGCELGNADKGCEMVPGGAPSSITYDIALNEDGSATFTIDVGGGGFWTFQYERAE